MPDRLSDAAGDKEPKIEISPNAQPFVDKYKIEIDAGGVSYLDEDGDAVHIAAPVTGAETIEATGNQEKIKVRFYAPGGSASDINLKEEKFPKPHVEKA